MPARPSRRYNRVYPAHGLGEPGAQLPARAWRQIAEELGASPVWAKQYSQVVKGESGGRPGIRGDDPGGTKGWGGPQITPGVQGPVFFDYMRKKGWTENDLRNPYVATEIALWMDKNSGADPSKGAGNWGNWYGTRFLNRNIDPSKVRSVLGKGATYERQNERQKQVTRTPGIDNSGVRQDLKLQYLQDRDNPNALLDLGLQLQGAKDTPGKVDIKYGRSKQKGADRVLRAKGGPTDIVALGKLAQKFGLQVGEHPKFGGVAPVHTAGSYHGQNNSGTGGDAIDVSGSVEAMQRYARAVARRHGKDVEELIWRGPGARTRKYGKKVPTNFYKDHTDHVHISDGDR